MEKELEDKFGLTFTIVESNKELIRMLQANDGLVRVIINYEKIRSTTQDDGAGEGNKLLKFLTESGKSFSFILAMKLTSYEMKTLRHTRVQNSLCVWEMLSCF